MKIILSTKKLTSNQRARILNASVRLVAYDAITIQPVAVDPDRYTDLKKKSNVIITSQNAARYFIDRIKELPFSSEDRLALRYFCVGTKTKALLTQHKLTVLKTEPHAAALARFIVNTYRDEEFTYFCSNERRDELPTILKEAGVSCNEVVTYETHLNVQSFKRAFDGVLFFSPSGVKSFVKGNEPLSLSPGESRGMRCFCIGETTAAEARKHYENVIVSNATTVESTIAKAVNHLKKEH